jgi:polysaccharide export outer membrane protein
MKQIAHILLLFVLITTAGTAARTAEAPQSGLSPAPLSSPAGSGEVKDATQQAAENYPIKASPDPPGEEYKIGSGDILIISVWKTDDLIREVIVLPDGTISFPLVGKIAAADRTLADLKQELEEKLKPYIHDPVISLSVKAVNSLNIYVIGRVNIPGRFVLFSNVDVLQALALAGGPNAFADRKNIRIFRKEDGKTVSIKFNYKEVTEGIHLEQNIMLKRGDVIVVP